MTPEELGYRLARESGAVVWEPALLVTYGCLGVALLVVLVALYFAFREV